MLRNRERQQRQLQQLQELRDLVISVLRERTSDEGLQGHADMTAPEVVRAVKELVKNENSLMENRSAFQGAAKSLKV